MNRSRTMPDRASLPGVQRGRRTAWFLSLAAGAAAWVAAACGGPAAPLSTLEGRWGGDGFELVVSRSQGSAVFDCARGSLETPVPLSGNGRFSAPGEYVREVGPLAARNPARYEGRVAGERLELLLTVTDTLGDEGTFTVGPFTGTLNGDPVVAFCQ